MPPKASSIRHLPRAESREPESSPSNRTSLSPFQKPNLPILRATPSSRRQFSYGAAAEPPPPRPGRGLKRGQVLDLSNAVRDALIRHDRDTLHNAPTSRAPSKSVDPEEDELAGADEAVSHTELRARASASAISRPQTGRMTEERDADDNRSFAIESDCYGDATIASSPGNMSPLRATRSVGFAAAAPTRLQPRAAKVQQSHHPQGPAQIGLAGNQSILGGDTVPSLAFKTQSSTEIATAHLGRIQREEEADLEDNTNKPLEHIDLPRRERIDAQDSRQIQTGVHSTTATGQTRTGPASPPESEDRVQHHFPSMEAQNLKGRQERPSRQSSDDESNENGSRALKRTPEGNDSGSQSSAETGRWLQGATKGTTVADVHAEHHHNPTRLSNGEGHAATTGLEDDLAIDWWQLLNPCTYGKAALWMAEATMQRLMESCHSLVFANLRGYFSSATITLTRVAVGALILTSVLALLGAGKAKFMASPVDDLWSPAAKDIPWYSVGGILGRIGGSLPTISWSPHRWDDMMDSWEMNDPRRSDIDDYLQKLEKAFRQLAEAGRLHQSSLKKLEAVVPKVVHMPLKDGKPVVAPEFWHALLDLIREDGSIMTFQRKSGGLEMSSERQWKAIAALLIEDPAFTNKINVSIGNIERKLDAKLTHWESWVRENDDKVKQRLGSALDQMKSVDAQRKWDERLGQLVQEQLREHEQEGRFVGRDEYLKLVQAEVATHVSEFRAELAQLQPLLETLVRESVDLAKGDTPPGMSHAQVTALVNGLVQKAFADINLEALAKGKIHAHWDSELRNQVNYFSIAAGATIDAKTTSPVYDPASKAYSALDLNKRGLRVAKPPTAALEPWHDDGDCWCAARATNHRGNPHGAMLAVQLAYRVVPQHLVIEHILPGATTEPGARPREIELYASIDDAEVRDRVRDFAAAHLPTSVDSDDDDSWNYMPADLKERFVMIGRLVYAGAELHGGVHVHRLSNELLALGAETYHVVVRAVSNYGAPDHTCFYHVRLYGHNVELDDRDELAGGAGNWQ